METHGTSPLEQLLMQFWAEALGIEGIQRDTDFFAAGGRLNEVGRLLTLVEDALHVAMAPDALRGAPTVAAFADALKHQVDHPGRLERLAEHLLRRTHPESAPQRNGQNTGASW
jgi:phosphopantetheine binding protein